MNENEKTNIRSITSRIAKAKPNAYKLTDSGNAERFAEQHRDRARYVAAWKTWVIWDGQRWQADNLAIQQLAKATARSFDAVIAAETNDDIRKALRSWATKTESRAGREHMVALARSEVGIVALPEHFDSKKWLLNVANGTVDLKTGNLRDHAREDMITKLAPVAYDPDAKTPIWDTFLAKVMPGEPGVLMIDYLQRLAGYALTGETTEQMFSFSYGAGGNGKGVFHHTIAKIMGDYGKTADTNMFLHDKNQPHPTVVANLAGARYVLCAEVPANRKFNEVLLKQMTGGDAISTRRLYEDEWEFQPQCKLFFSGNYKPEIQGQDEGIWRRVRLIPWGVVIPPDKSDKTLEERLEAELPGILAWAVQGCKMWQEKGLGIPPEVAEATGKYREESDAFAEFFDSRCEFGTELKTARVDMRRAYERWCGEQGARPFGPKPLSAALRRKGVSDSTQRTAESQVKAWKGVRLR